MTTGPFAQGTAEVTATSGTSTTASCDLIEIAPSKAADTVWASTGIAMPAAASTPASMQLYFIVCTSFSSLLRRFMNQGPVESNR